MSNKIVAEGFHMEPLCTRLLTQLLLMCNTNNIMNTWSKWWTWWRCEPEKLKKYWVRLFSSEICVKKNTLKYRFIQSPCWTLVKPSTSCWEGFRFKPFLMFGVFFLFCFWIFTNDVFFFCLQAEAHHSTMYKQPIKVISDHGTIWLLKQNRSLITLYLAVISL